MGFNNRFRKSVGKIKDRKSQTRGGYDRPAWATTNFTMDTDESPGRSRILDPGEEGFQCFDFHRVGGREQTCTCELPEFAGKCVYCHYYDSAERDSWERKNLYQRFRWIIELIDFRFGHPVSEKREDGSERKLIARCGSDEAIPKFKRGRSCKHCSAGVDRIFGGHKIWTLTSKQFEPLKDLDMQLQQTAYKVEKDEESGEEKIVLLEAYTTGFICGNCGDQCLIKWKGEDTPLDEKAIGMLGEEDPQLLEEWAANEYECSACDAVGEPVEEWVATDDDDNEYDDCERLSLFDQSLKITCSGVKKGEKTFRDYNFNESEYPMCHMIEELEEMKFDEKEIEEMITPFDLYHMHRPQWIDPTNEKYEGREDEYIAAVLESQAKTIQNARGDKDGSSYPNPYASQSSTKKSQPFASRSKFRSR